MKKHILFVEHSPQWGGAANVLRHLIEQNILAEYLAPVLVCNRGSAMEKYFSDKGIAVCAANIPWFSKKGNLRIFLSYLTSYLAFVIFFRGLIKKYDVAVIHANGFISALLVAIPAALAQIPVVWHMHDILAESLLNRICIRFAVWSSKRIICVSNAVKDALVSAGVSVEKCRIVYNCVPLRPEGCFPAHYSNNITFSQDEMAVGMISNLCVWKGQMVMLKAFEKILFKFPDARLVIVGDVVREFDYGYKQQLKKTVEALGITDRVIFTGFREDVFDILSALDIVVHPSVLPEPFGLVILEAMYCGKPVVASNLGGIPEIVVHGRSGLLVPPEQPQALADAVCRLIENPQMRVNMGKEGKQIVSERFSQDKFYSGIKSVYDELSTDISCCG